MSPYREMDVRQPRRGVNWRRLVTLLIGVAIGHALVWHGPAGWRAAMRWSDGVNARAEAREAQRRASKIANCRAHGGTWNEGRNGGNDTEWCSGVTR